MSESAPAPSPGPGKLLSQHHDDPEMRDLLELFLTELPERLAQMQQAFDAGNLSAVRSLAHQLKGACGGYGFPQLSVAAGAVEATARSATPDLEAVAEQVRELLATCRRAL